MSARASKSDKPRPAGRARREAPERAGSSLGAPLSGAADNPQVQPQDGADRPHTPAASGEVNRIVCADAVEFLASYPGPRPNLIFADPPFNIGYQYDRYRDELPYDAYVHWTGDWMRVCADALDPAGSFYVAIGDEYAAEVRLAARTLGLTLRNWIIWHYTFGQQTRRKFARAHAHIFYFVKDPKRFTFNDEAVRVPSDRQLIYNDRRANPKGRLPDDVWTICERCYKGQLPPSGDATDVWTVSRVCGTFRERVQWHPCQMPEKLLERIILASSNPGDLVFDPFAGSGTSLAAAKRLGRRYLGTDVSPDYVANTRRRLEETEPLPVAGRRDGGSAGAGARSPGPEGPSLWP